MTHPSSVSSWSGHHVYLFLTLFLESNGGVLSYGLTYPIQITGGGQRSTPIWYRQYTAVAWHRMVQLIARLSYHKQAHTNQKFHMQASMVTW